MLAIYSYFLAGTAINLFSFLFDASHVWIFGKISRDPVLTERFRALTGCEREVKNSLSSINEL